MNATDYDTIERYLKDSLDDNEKRIVEERLSVDAEFRNAFHEEKKIFIIVNRNQFQSIDKSIQNSLTELEEEGFFKEDKNRKTPPSKALTYWLGAAAAMIGILFFYANFKYSNDRLFQNGNEKIGFEIQDISRDANQNNPRNALNNIKQLVATSQWNDGINEISAIKNTDPQYLDAQLHLAYIYLKMKKPDQAIIVSDMVLKETIDPIKIHTAEWLKVQAFVKSENKFESMLQDIIDNKTHTFSKEALEVQQHRSRFWNKLVLSK